MRGGLVVVVVVVLALTAAHSRVGGDPPPPQDPPAAERPRPASPAAGARADERVEMVKRQISHPRDGRTPVTDEAVLDAMRGVPRHVFMPEARQRQAYRDSPLPIGYGQTISQPYSTGFCADHTNGSNLGPGHTAYDLINCKHQF